MTNPRFPSAVPAPGPEAGPALPIVDWGEIQMPAAPPVAAQPTPDQVKLAGYLDIDAIAAVTGVPRDEITPRLVRGTGLVGRFGQGAQDSAPAAEPAAPTRDVKKRVVGANDGETQAMPVVPSPPNTLYKKISWPTASPATSPAPNLAKPTDGHATDTEAPRYYTLKGEKADEVFFSKPMHYKKVLTEERFKELFGADALAADPDLKAEYQDVHPVYLNSPEERSTGSYIAIPERDNVLGWRRDTVRDKRGKKVKLPPALLPEDMVYPDNTPVLRRRKRRIPGTAPTRVVPKILRGDDEPAAEPVEATAPARATPEVLSKEGIDAYFALKEEEFAQEVKEKLASVQRIIDARFGDFDFIVNQAVERRLAELGESVAAAPQVAPEIAAAQIPADKAVDEEVKPNDSHEKRRRQVIRAAKVAGVTAVAGMGVAVAAVRRHKR